MVQRKTVPLWALLALAALLGSCAGSPERADPEPTLAQAEERAPAPADTDDRAGGARAEAPRGGPDPASSPAAPATGEGADTSGEPKAESGFLGLATETPPGPPGGRTARAPALAPRQAQASGLRAGFADDNKQFNYFVQFLDLHAQSAPHEVMDVQERILIRVSDNAGKPVANAVVSVWDGPRRLLTARTYADGTVLFFPRMHAAANRYRVTAVSADRTVEMDMSREGPRSVGLSLPAPRRLPDRVALDVVFVLDTTGSMGEEIERLKLTIELIDLNLTAVSTSPRVRFGLVLYKDIGDEYVTQVVQPTDSLERFQAALAGVEADGGGDTAEDLRSALRELVNTVTWNPDGIRLAFVITDAPPHLDYDDAYPYARSARDAQARGIKIHSVGTGGLDIAGEYVLRQISQYTYGRYIFLTYGEGGESEGGAPGSVSHHTGANYQTDKLETIIIRLAREELAHQSDTPLETEEEYFEAVRVTDEQRTQTLGKLFDQAVQQLIDYSSVRVPPTTRAAAAPLVAAQTALAPQAEYLSEQLELSLSRSKAFQAVARSDLQAILEELELQLSGLVDDATAVRVGGILGAEVLVTGRVFAQPQRYELFLKLLRVSTGEILAVTKALVDRDLGI
jgi:Mg-chelatase subunit ChlD